MGTKNLSIIWIGLILLILSFAILPVVATCTPADTGSAGNDTIVCASNNAPVQNVEGRGGNDSFHISSTLTTAFDFIGDGGNGSGNDTIVVFGTTGDVIGDQHTHLNAGGNDSFIIATSGEVDGDVIGDDGGNQGGNDNVNMNVGSLVTGDIIGDRTSGNGGIDTITVFGNVQGNIYGDVLIGSGFTGGTDSLGVGLNGVVDGIITGDENDTSHSHNIRGGNDTIVINGIVNNLVYGDYTGGNGGNDSIYLSNRVAESIVGDQVKGTGGDDTIFVDMGGDVAKNVIGDNDNRKGGPGGNDEIIIHGTVGNIVFGDGTRQDGGNDVIQIGSNSSNKSGFVGKNILGDFTKKAGGNDSIQVLGTAIVERNLRGDVSKGDGGDDRLWVGVNAQVKQSVFGDDVRKATAAGGDDTIVIDGTVNNNIAGDHEFFKGLAGHDSIFIDTTGVVGGNVYGDRAEGFGGDDTLFILGQVNGTVRGDDVQGKGGKDSIVIFNDGIVKGNLNGDYSEDDGGNDLILVRGTVDKNVSGDNQPPGFSITGGHDDIKIEGLVKGSVWGDNTKGDGGNDTIAVSGTVEGDVFGDKVDGLGGLDFIFIQSTGIVNGDVFGDKAGTPANLSTVGADDTILVNGTVHGTVDPDGSIGGHDVVVVAGYISGDIASSHDNGIDGDDVFVIQNGGIVRGLMNPGSHINGDRLVFDLSTASKAEYRRLADVFDSLTIDDGTVAYRGNRYKWVNFEFLTYIVQLLQTRTLPLYCSGIYEKNDAGTACVRKGQEEVDAIMFHRNNPGYDGRLPGTEACAIYNYGSAMRVYEVVDGSEGELVTTISADVFNHNIHSNLLLASSASGKVNVYYLRSNEVQIECTDVHGKTQVRIIPDFSGRVNASFDKEQG